MKKIPFTTLVFILFALSANAQETMQATIGGIPPILPSPYISDIENNYYQGQYHVQLNYSSNNPDPAAFVWEISLTKNGAEVARAISEKVWYEPGMYYYQAFDDIPEVRFKDDLYDYFEGDDLEMVIRTGLLAEGSYLLTIEVIPSDAFQMTSSIPGFAYFEVRYPQPPLLISPLDESLAPPVYNVFTWTPVIPLPGLQFEYEILIVEVEKGQTPLQAIQANLEHVLHTSSQPLFIHTPDELPFEQGKTYAWRVKAYEVNDMVPISDGGMTEIFTFTAGDLFVDFDDLESIQLIPDFAEVIHLDQLDVAYGDYSITLDGWATLRIFLPDNDGMVIDIDILCQDLEVHMITQHMAVAVGGEVSGHVEAGLFPYYGVGDIITLNSIQWSLYDGLTVDAEIIDPTGGHLQAEGVLSLGPAGLSGSITATSPKDAPLFGYGASPLEFTVHSITATFPGGYLTMDAQLKFFSEPTPCQLTDILITESPSVISFSCNIKDTIPLVPGRDLAALYLHNALGIIEIDWESEAGFSFEAHAGGAIHLNALHGKLYEIPMVASVSSVEGVIIQAWPPAMITHPPPIDLGIAELIIQTIKDPYISYDQTVNEWDFGLDFDASLRFPDFDDLEVTGFADITLDRHGIHFPGYHFVEDQLMWIPPLELAGFGARLSSFTLPEFTFPWFDWDGMLPGPWDFSFGFTLTTPNFENHLPACLRNLSLEIEDATFSGGSFAAHLPSTTFPAGECSFPLGAGYKLEISELGGGIFGEVYGGAFSLDGYASLDAALLLGTPFDCSEASAIGLSAEKLSIRGDGIIEGEFVNVIPPCPLKIGPYTAGIHESLLTFFRDGDSQQAGFDATAYLEFPVPDGSMRQIQGELGLNLMTGEFHTLYFHIDEPFAWKIPADEEVLRFHIDEAIISQDGMFITGAQEFVVEEHTINVMFHDLLLDLFDFRVISGSIEFEAGFALQAGINPADFSLAYQALPPGSGLSEELDPGIFFELAGEIRIDSDGLHASGTADAAIKFFTFSTQNLKVRFSDDFALGLDPFQVASGEIEVIYDGMTVAIIDPQGFHPSFDFIDLEALIPERLPLPSHSVAYLQLKQDGELMVNIEPHPEMEFALIISTINNQNIDFVFPILQGDLAYPPSIDVAFSNLVVSLSPLSFESGEVSGTVPDGDDRFDLSRFGVPLSLKHIYYGIIEEENINLDGLFFSGELKLFETRLGDDANASFRVTSDGELTGSIELEDLDAKVPLVPGSDLAVLNIQSVTGYGQYNILHPGLSPNFSLDLAGSFLLQVDDDHYAGASISILYDQHMLTTDFQHHFSAEVPYFDFHPFLFKINEIQSLSLNYDKEDGFDFYAALDFEFGMILQEDSLLFPLNGVEIRPNGFAIPAQEVHDGTSPPLMVDTFEMMGFRFEPLAFRTHDVVVDVFNLSPGDLSGLIPRLDLAISFPGLEEMAPAIEGLSLTVNNAGFQNGRLTGEVDVYEPFEPITIPFGDNELIMKSFTGALSEITENGIPEQAININVEGEVPPFHQFDTEEECEPVLFAFSIIQGSGFSGTIDSFIPCGEISFGRMALSFLESSLELDYMDNEQSAMLAGSAQLTIPREEEPPLNIQGYLGFDLMTGSLADGALEITDPFQWGFPADAEDPFLLFDVGQARLDTEGFTLMADGSLNITEHMQVAVTFNNLLIDLTDLQIKDGEVLFAMTDFAFDLMFLPVSWRMVPPDHTLPDDKNIIRLGMDNIGIMLDKDGLGLSGEGIAEMHLLYEPDQDDENGDEVHDDDEEFSFGNLRMVFLDDFRMNMPPASRAKNGRMELWMDEEDDTNLLAWYDTNGIGFGDLLVLFDIPDTLGLPYPESRELAYMVLREDGELMVEFERDASVNTLRTIGEHGVKVVLACMTDEDGNMPSFRTAFNVSVNDMLEIVDGSISVNLTDTEDVLPGNEPLKIPGLPLSLTSIHYDAGDEVGPGVLSASALLELPEGLGDMQVVIDEVRLSEEGFEQATFSVGIADFDHESDEPEFKRSFLEDAFVINIFHAMISFGQETSFAFSGTFQSHLLADKHSEEKEALPFIASYDHQLGRWDFSVVLDNFDDPLDMGFACLAITELDVTASSDEFALILSGVVSLPDLLGDDFAVTIEGLSIGSKGISMDEFDYDTPQQFSFFQDKVEALLDYLSGEYSEGVLYVSLNGNLTVLGREATLHNMRVGTDGSVGFGDDGGLNIELLTSNLNLLPYEYLVINQITFGIQEVEVNDQMHACFSMSLDGRAKLPEPVDDEADLQVVLALVDGELKTSFSGPHFELDADQGEGIFQITEGIAFQLTAVKADIDFKHADNTAIMANGILLLENEDGSKNKIFFGSDIDDSPGFRYRVADGATWNASATGTPQNPLFEYRKSLFRLSIHSAETYDPEVFGVMLDGSIDLDFSALEMMANFTEMKINTKGIDSWGSFKNGGSIKIMNYLSLAIEHFDFAPNGGVLELLEVTDGFDEATEDDIEEAGSVWINTQYHFLIENAYLTITGNTDEGGGSDLFNGGVKKFLFYRCADTDELLFQLDSAYISLQDHASANLSLKYSSGGSGESYHLSASGSVTVFDTTTLGMAGMIESDQGKMRFGLFVKADFSPGIPVLVPNVLTINGLGGGFYYNPRHDDFSVVYNLAQMEFHAQYQPVFASPSFAAFLYAGVSVIEVGSHHGIDGAFFMEVTNDGIVIHVDGELLGQGERLNAQSYLEINWDAAAPYLQGGVQVSIDYGSPLTGSGNVAFFVGDSPEGTIWAVWGGTEIGFFILNTDSEFILCNEGLLMDFGLDFYLEKSTWLGTWIVEADIGASVWYIYESSDFGAYAILYGLLDGPGFELEAELLGAYISTQKHTLFYAQGCGSYELLFIGSGDACGNVSFYNDEGWSASRGRRDDMVDLIHDAQQNAQAMEDATEEIQSNVNNIMEEMDAAANVEDIIEFLNNLIGGFWYTNEAYDNMQEKIDHINSMAPLVNENLSEIEAEGIDMLIEAEVAAVELENPVTFIEGIVSGETIDDYTVTENPEIQFSSTQDAMNIDQLLDDIETRQNILEHFEGSIAKAMVNLAKLEMIMEGAQHLSLEFADNVVILTGDGLIHQFNQYGSGFGIPGGGHFSIPGFGNPYNPYNLNHFAEVYTDAVGYIKEFYSKAIGTLWSYHYAYQHEEDWVTATDSAIVAYSDHFDEVYTQVLSQHEAYTQSVDHLYQIKGQMITTIYGMVMSYLSFAEEYLDDDQVATMQTMQIELAQALEPPVINSFIVNSTLAPTLGYHNKAQITWLANHPQQVIENSYSISDEGIGQFTSAGEMQSLTHYSFKRTDEEETRNFQVSVRARGTGGNTGIQTTNVNVAVDIHGSSSPAGEQIPDDVPNPSNPIVTLPYKSKTYKLPWSPFPYIVHYTNDPSRIDLSISAYAEASDIVGFEYALGSTPAGTDVVDWTEAVGVIETADIDEGGITRIINTSIYNLSLEHNTFYYISVRAYNTHGGQSQTSYANSSLLFDATPPDPPSSVMLVEAPDPEQNEQGNWPIYSQVASPPQWESPKFSPPTSYTPPAVSFQWEHGQDDVSGILGYEYTLTEISDPQLAFLQATHIWFTNENEVSIEGPPVSYTDPLFFHIRSKNRAGSYSEQTITLDHVTAKDITPPTRPVVHVRIFGNSLRLHIPALSVDPESQVIGYQYSIGSTPGAADFRDWSSGVGFVQDIGFYIVYQPVFGYHAPVLYPDPTNVPQHIIPTTGLPQETTMYLNVRAINAAKMVSEVSTSGPFQLGTNPAEPVVNLGYNSDSGNLLIGLENIYDAGAAIHQVAYRVKMLDTGNHHSWVNVPSLKGFHAAPASHPAINHWVPESENGYQVKVTVTNTSMKSTTVVKDYTHPITFIPPPDFNPIIPPIPPLGW